MVILVDTSVWVDHFNRGDDRLIELMGRKQVVVHPYVIGELALGNLRDGELRIAQLQALAGVAVLPPEDWLHFVRRHRLNGSGLGFVDAHLLGSAEVSGLKLWSRDKRLAAQAEKLGLDWSPANPLP